MKACVCVCGGGGGEGGHFSVGESAGRVVSWLCEGVCSCVRACVRACVCEGSKHVSISESVERVGEL